MKPQESGTSLPSYRKMNWRATSVRRLAMYFVIFLVATLTLLLVLLSPILLRQLGLISGIDWTKLSNIGQTYGAASAVLSGIALVGISLSLLIQARQARNERIRLVFERHVQLLAMALEHLDIYGPVIGLNPPPGIDARQYLFSTMLMNYHRLGFLAGTIPEEDLRGEALSDIFGAEPARIWWEHVRALWLNSPGLDRRDRKFARIVEDEYCKAVTRRPTVVQRSQDLSTEISEPKDRKVLGVVTSLSLGIAVAIFFRSRHCNKRS